MELAFAHLLDWVWLFISPIALAMIFFWASTELARIVVDFVGLGIDKLESLRCQRQLSQLAVSNGAVHNGNCCDECAKESSGSWKSHAWFMRVRDALHMDKTKLFKREQ